MARKRGVLAAFKCALKWAFDQEGRKEASEPMNPLFVWLVGDRAVVLSHSLRTRHVPAEKSH